jgi:membrane fusion protein (multidrug efflux system)
VVQARLVAGVDRDVVLVPQQGVSRTPTGEATALVVGAANKVERRRLVLARAVGNQWLVSSGLKAGDRLIVEGLQRVRPDQTVTPVAAGSRPPGRAASGAAAARGRASGAGASAVSSVAAGPGPGVGAGPGAGAAAGTGTGAGAGAGPTPAAESARTTSPTTSSAMAPAPTPTPTSTLPPAPGRIAARASAPASVAR